MASTIAAVLHPLTQTVVDRGVPGLMARNHLQRAIGRGSSISSPPPVKPPRPGRGRLTGQVGSRDSVNRLPGEPVPFPG
jgi:hypothetical protein